MSRVKKVKTFFRDRALLLAPKNLFRNSDAQMKRALVRALSNGELYCEYQPIVDLRHQRVVGLEALIRWNSGIYGQVPPSTLIPFAEKHNLMRELTELVFHSAINSLKNPLLKGFSGYVSINFSRSTLLDEDFVQKILDISKTSPDLKRRVILELTEADQYSRMDMPKAHAQIQKLRNFGYRIAMDDFGTGYSGLSLLHSMPIDVVKIDKVFVDSIEDQPSSRDLMEAMVDMIQKLKLTVVVEGVESWKQVQILKSVGVSYVQGYHFSKPLTIEKLFGFLSTQKGSREGFSINDFLLAIS